MQSSLRQRCYFHLFHLLFLSMLILCVVMCLCTGLWFSSITSLGSFQKYFTFQVTKRSFDFYMFSSCSFLFLMYCDVCIWQLIPKTCFVLFFSCMDLKRARKYHVLMFLGFLKRIYASTRISLFAVLI